MLNFFGKIGKGFATIAGVVTTAAAALTGHGAVADAVHQIAQSGAAIVAAAGVILAAFGFGRKAGDAAAAGK